MDIRRAVKSDIKRIDDLLLQVLTVHHNGRPDLFKPDCRKYSDAELEEIINDDARPIFVADDGEVKGYAFCIIKDEKNNNVLTDRKTLYIDDLCVDENSRGEHIGSALYEFVKRYAKSIACNSVTLNVWECNGGARAFYEKLGLKPMKTTMEEIL